MKKVLLALLLTASPCFLFAQQTGVPASYTLKEGADYGRYEKNVLTAIDWLMATPPDAQAEEHKKVNTFLLQWVSGSPEVSIEVMPEIVTFVDNPPMIMIFMAGWTRYAITTRKFDDKINGNLKGLESVIAYYKKNKDVLKADKEVDKLVKLQQENKLADFVKQQLQ